MILIGLTGSLATGKSTTSNLLRAPPHNLPIIDADVLARQVVEPGTYGYNRVVRYFGPTTPDLLLPAPPPSSDHSQQLDDDDGDDDPTRTSQTNRSDRLNKKEEQEKQRSRPINRAALGRRVFGTSPTRLRDRKVLNGIVHPLVRLAMVRQLLYYHLLGHWAVVLDIPLLYESGLDVFCSVVVMVAVSDAKVQMRRLRERDPGLSLEEAEGRVASQMGVGEKVERTRVREGKRGKVVINDGGRKELEQEVARVIGEIRQEGGGWVWNAWLWQSPIGCLLLGARECLRSWRVRKGWMEQRGREKANL